MGYIADEVSNDTLILYNYPNVVCEQALHYSEYLLVVCICDAKHVIIVNYTVSFFFIYIFLLRL